MVNVTYPEEEDFRVFVAIIKKRNFTIKKYLPHIDNEWYKIVLDCINYVRYTSNYENLDIHEIVSKILYKIAKRHEFGDGNKRSGVICVVVFCLINDYFIKDPQKLKNLARRIAKTRGRTNENLIRKRITTCLKDIMVPISE